MTKKSKGAAKKASIDRKAGSGNDDEKKFDELGMKLPKEAEKKLKELKAKLDSFQDKVVKKFDKYIIGIALMPPQKQQVPPTMQIPASVPGVATAAHPSLKQPEALDKPAQEKINVLVLVDDSDSQRMSKLELKTKLAAIIQKMAEDEDKNMQVETLILSEVWQNCFDAKYEILQTIAMSLPIYDNGMLSAIKIAEIHKTMVLKKFEKYIVSYVLAGSLVQGRATKTSDVDVWVVIDDTDVKRMTRAELKDKLRAIIIQMGFETGDMTGIKNKLNIQVYILTDFWDNLKEANPIIFTLLRDGVPFYDRGIFMPWKQLLKMGKIKPSQEAIDMFMSTGDQMLKAVEFKIKNMGMEDIYYAILTPSQAAIMLYGFPPPAPSETADVMSEIFVKKEKMLTEEDISILRNNIKVRKEIEHGTKKDLSGKELDQMLSDAQKYLKRIQKLFEEIQKMKEEESIIKIYDTTTTVVRDILNLEGACKVSEAELAKVFDEEMVCKGKVPGKYTRTLTSLIKAKKDYEANKLTKLEIENVKKESNEFIRFMIEYMQRKRGKEFERAKLRFKHGQDKLGEVLLLGELAFILHDVDAEQKKVSRAKLSVDGRLTGISDSSIEEMDAELAKVDVPPKVFLKEGLFESLRGIFGKDVQILLNY